MIVVRGLLIVHLCTDLVKKFGTFKALQKFEEAVKAWKTYSAMKWYCDSCTRTLDFTSLYGPGEKFVTFAIHKSASVSSTDKLIALHLIFF